MPTYRIVVLLLLLALCLLPLCIEGKAKAESLELLVAADQLRLREAPSAASAALDTLWRGERLTLLESSDGWVKVQRGTQQGWVCRRYLEAPEGGALWGWTILLDAGHGGSQTGTSHAGIKEKEIALSVTLALRERLEAEGAEVILTRAEDSSLSLYQRAAMANALLLRRSIRQLPVGAYTARQELQEALSLCNEALATGQGIPTLFSKPDSSIHPLLALAFRSAWDHPKTLFVSIHGNDTPDGQPASGVEIYYTPDQPSASYSGYVGYDTQARQRLSACLLASLSQSLGLQARGSFAASFAVLREHNIPSALVELGFLNHPYDRSLLASPEGQRKAVEGVAEGILNYAGVKPGAGN